MMEDRALEDQGHKELGSPVLAVTVMPMSLGLRALWVYGLQLRFKEVAKCIPVFMQLCKIYKGISPKINEHSCLFQH